MYIYIYIYHKQDIYYFTSSLLPNLRRLNLYISIKLKAICTFSPKKSD